MTQPNDLFVERIPQSGQEKELMQAMTQLGIYPHQEVDRVCGWLKSSMGYEGEFSELGQLTAVLFDRLWGLHHLNKTSLKKVNWANGYYIEFVYDRELATVDRDDLTRLVVLAHQMMLRVSVEGAAPRYLRILVHQRQAREGTIFERCPHIRDVVEVLTAKYPAIDGGEQ